MDWIGLDVHKRDTQVCVLTDTGAVEERRVPSTPAGLSAALGGRAPAAVLLEAATESEWVARHLEAYGHAVTVADPNYAPMYGTRTRRVKTDRRDARALADACRLGLYRPAHRLSAAQRLVRHELATRAAVVHARTRLVNTARSTLRQHGVKLSLGIAKHFGGRVERRIATGEVPAPVAERLAPLLVVLGQLDAAVRAYDATIGELSRTDPVVRRLRTVPGVGPVTAACFVATIDDAGRFASAHQLEAFLGLVPQEWSSGERLRRGRITKTGNRRMRWLLIECAVSLLRPQCRGKAPELTTWARGIAARAGHGTAVVALARRLAGILYAVWRDGTEYRPADRTDLRGGAAAAPAA